ncbi:MAG: alpha/beta fold hydrolase [Methylocystis sp.]
MPASLLGGERYTIQNFSMQCGAVLPELHLVYKTYGTLSPTRDNAILFPTWCSSNHNHNEWLIGHGRVLDPGKYFIVCVDLLGNGLSSSPSNTPPPFDRRRFPPVSILDNVRAQRRMTQDLWGIDVFALVVGRSMGAQTALQWGSYFPDSIRSLLAISGAARTTPHAYIFLEGVITALKLDPTWMNGDYVDQPRNGLRAVGRLYAGWSISQAYYREGLHMAEVPAATSIEDYLVRRWDSNFFRCDANDLLSQFETWQRFDVSNNEGFKGSWENALNAITARSIVMPGRTDLYFPPEDSAMAVALMRNAELRVIDSVWGHRAGAPNSPEKDVAFVEAALRDLLNAN